MSQPLPLSFADVEKAAERLAGQAVATPLLENWMLNEQTGARVFLKPELLQHNGSFKFRGAYNKLSSLSDSERQQGVVAMSSGNHAQGVALAAKRLGIKATIVMPATAPRIKLANTKALGAEVIVFDPERDDRDAFAKGILRERGGIFVHPYDDPLIMAGQGTAGLELVQQAKALGALPDMVFVCCGGGGLTAGMATAVKHLIPEADVYAVEPVGFDDTVRSLKSGVREGNIAGAKTICDAITTPMPGALTFPVLQHYGVQGIAVNDDEVRAAMRFAFHRLKLVVEPGGAVALAAVLAGKVDIKGKTIAAILSGGNVDPALFASTISSD